jgi:hypothetical protein
LLLKIIGQLTLECDYLMAAVGKLADRGYFNEFGGMWLTMTIRCELLGINRSTAYFKLKRTPDEILLEEQVKKELTTGTISFYLPESAKPQASDRR